jgi:uncharacterized membrane protein
MTTIEATPALSRSSVDLALALKGGWRVFTADIVPLLLGGLIALVLSIVTLGILAGPLFAGLYKMAVGRIRDGKPAEISDLFDCLERFGAFFAAALVLGLLIGLASITIVGGILLATIWMYVFPLMVDRGLSLGEAMKTSYHLVVDQGFWEHLALVILLLALNGLADGPLGLITMPFTIATLAAAYFVADSRGDLVARV